MIYVFLVLIALFIFFMVTFLAFRSALNNSDIARELKEIRILLMKSQNEDGNGRR